MYDQLDGLAPQSSERASTCRKDMIPNYSADKTEDFFFFFFFSACVSIRSRALSFGVGGVGWGGGVRDLGGGGQSS